MQGQDLKRQLTCLKLEAEALRSKTSVLQGLIDAHVQARHPLR